MHCQYCKNTGETPLSHAKFRTLLHEQLINLSQADFQQVTSPDQISANTSPNRTRSSVSTHHLEFADDKQRSGKMRYRICKVCSILHTDASKPIGKSRAFCAECSSEKCRIYLCDRIRNNSDNNQMTCFQIWHQLWKNGTEKDEGRPIRMRASPGHQRSESFVSFASTVDSTNATEF